MAIAVTPTKTTFLNTAALAVLTLPLLASAALAQDNEGSTQAGDQTQQQAQGGQAQAQGQNMASDALVATIGDAEIRNSDLMRAIGELPAPLNAQPLEMLVPMALESLLVREAIVQEARSQGLAQDPEVQSLVQGATRAAEDDALVQVWLQREFQNRVTPEAVDAAYAGLQAVAGDQPVPPLDQIRPQIEQSLTQQAFSEIQGSLLSNAQVTLYGPDGQPLQPQQGSAGGQGGDAASGQDGSGAAADQTGDASNGGQDQAQEGTAGENTSGDGD